MEKLELETQFILGSGIYEIWSSSFAAEVRKGGKILKRFKGEMATMDAERFVDDILINEVHGVR